MVYYSRVSNYSLCNTWDFDCLGFCSLEELGQKSAQAFYVFGGEDDRPGLRKLVTLGGFKKLRMMV